MSECDLKRTMKRDFATSHLHAGGKVEVLSRILGHGDNNATYLHYDKQPLDDLAIDASSIAHI